MLQLKLEFWEPSEELEFDAECVGGTSLHLIGEAGEYLVAADLSIAGYQCFPASSRMHYDLIMHTDEDRLLRVQVKACSRSNSDFYSFSTKSRGYPWRKEGRVDTLPSYDGHADLFAFAALDRRCVIYAKVNAASQSVRIRAGQFTQDASEMSLRAALQAI